MLNANDRKGLPDLFSPLPVKVLLGLPDGLDAHIFRDEDLSFLREQRQVWVDWLRVLACLLVMVVHSSEPFYLAGYDTLILTRSDLLWASIIDSAARMSVTLFVVASSYLMFPLHYSTAEFCRKRAVRILIPFAIWSLVYALKSDAPATNIKYLLLNFNFSASHLWFIYMLLGLYLIMPLLSPWAREVGRKELRENLKEV